MYLRQKQFSIIYINLLIHSTQFSNFKKTVKMKKIIMLVAILLAFNTSFSFAQGGWNALKGSGKIVTLRPNTIDFDKIETNLPGKIIIEVGKAKSLEIEIDDNLSNFLTIKEDDKEHKLTFKFDLQEKKEKIWVQNTNIVVRVSMPEMSVFTQKSNGDAEVNGLYGRYFRAENYGNGNIILRGAKIDVCDIESQGNGDINAANLTATKAKVRLKGNGNVRFNATDSYEAKLNGNGDIQNSGTGKATKIDRVGNGNVTDEKPMKSNQGSTENAPQKVKIRFQNNSAVPRKVAFIFYEPSENGRNSTAIKVLLPIANASFSVEVGTRFYNADGDQVGTLMGGGKLSDKPFYTVQSGDNAKRVKLY